MPASLTRRVTFAAAHRYRVAQRSDDKNERTFGLCARPNYHGPPYVRDVTVSVEIDQQTGLCVDLGELDGILAAEVRGRFDHRNINLDVAEFADGKLMPTGENLARFIFERVRAQLVGGPRVIRVTVAEDSTLSTTYES